MSPMEVMGFMTASEKFPIVAEFFFRANFFLLV